jgi:hypothetical protein
MLLCYAAVHTLKSSLQIALGLDTIQAPASVAMNLKSIDLELRVSLLTLRLRHDLELSIGDNQILPDSFFITRSLRKEKNIQHKADH